MRTFLLVLTLLFLGSCSPSSQEDFLREGEALSRKIVLDLQKIQTKEDLVRMTPLLKKRFCALVELMIQARERQEKEWEGAFVDPQVPLASFNELFVIELERIFSLERGREIMEKAQKQALDRLDACERQLKQRRDKPRRR
ncbi:MAG: hypothetical protein A2Y28_00385 [Chlamydiae bacterium GWC2_50_10]|nr:MAG: hypothetical protein A2Y28_00385 [Chlamydiae bacterium GWC2_50_10]OGN57856.1 MAG: hypothetical protein A3D18_03290 [Chlamydiae bacterium RIFCSPHIGHO2_02_FULL_49_29]OGN63323.1 MAG: hypothetical protein A3E26_00155 [Chlamydiae bacterium RIFCSPHIGHO2_12_FULL_49_32]OGN71891.1 MAG: hypothetical protein A3I15_05985 [Chlamydiae bacterium RIFCSPLOWO2_02_FULL_49_12]OGN75150.1 MAG: hypothetical protein A3G30_00015 [Chlamydiae bacterium RIFCSPLOWO2_12_FULL_49_12]HAZ15474.1 hypothetical protein [P